MNKSYGWLRRVLVPLFGVLLALASAWAHADENFVPGIYQDSRGNQYLVSGGAPSQTGRTQWTVTSTIPKVGTTNTFNAIWETGAAVGNSYLAGNANVTTYPAGYLSGRSYGVVGNNNWTWNTGTLISASQVGPTLVINYLRNDGSTITSTTLTYLSSSPVAGTSDSSETYRAGIYQDSTGKQYLVSGGAPSQAGRTQWTVASIAGTTNVFNAIWETGAAVGNTYLAGSSNVTANPAGYLSGRSYGVVGNNNWTWNTGTLISASQVGPTLVINYLRNDGSTITSTTLTYLSASPVAGTSDSSETYRAGIYQDSTGKQYLVSGGAVSQAGRTQWTVASTPAGGTNTFNAIWETGAAVGNSYLAGNANVATYPAGYLSGRSYGVVGNNNWTWNTGTLISASQVGPTLVINYLRNDGSTITSTTLTGVNLLLSQTINFTNPGPKTLGAAPFALSATGGASGNPVTFTSQTTGVCTMSGSTATLVAAGTCTIAANQAGNVNYFAAPQVTQSITVTAASTGTPVCTLTASPASISAGSSSTLTSSCSPAATSYVWTGGTCAGSTASTCTVSPTATTTYSVTGSNANGAGTSSNVTVTVTGNSVISSLSFNPPDEAVGVPISTNVVVTFSAPIQRGTGNIVLKNASGAVIETFDAATSGRLSISGAALTINPTANLNWSAGYKVEFDAGTVKDLVGNSYAGTTNYNFTTTSEPNESEIEKLYIAYFNRPADLGGLAYWAGLLANGVSMATIQNSFSSSAEYQAIYSGQQNTTLIAKLYQNLFGRQVSVTDAGVLWWANEMAAGRQTITTIAGALSSGTTPGSADNIAVIDKIVAASEFTGSLETTAERNGYVGAGPFAVASNWLATIHDDASFTTAMTSLNATIAAAVVAP